MRNIDAIINKLANEQQRCEHLLIDEINAVKKATQLFFDKQAREADSFIALISTTLDDIINRVQNGYPANEGLAHDDSDPLPAIVTRKKILPAQLEAAERAVEAELESGAKDAA